jgi:hypothetical protein
MQITILVLKHIIHYSLVRVNETLFALFSLSSTGSTIDTSPLLRQEVSLVVNSTHTEPLTKASFYLTPEQANKLDDLAHDFKKAHGKRINRNDIVRYLIDQCSLETLDSMEPS